MNDNDRKKLKNKIKIVYDNKSYVTSKDLVVATLCHITPSWKFNAKSVLCIYLFIGEFFLSNVIFKWVFRDHLDAHN